MFSTLILRTKVQLISVVDEQNVKMLSSGLTAQARRSLISLLKLKKQLTIPA